MPDPPPRNSLPRTSRRSFPNLHHLSLAPLSSKYPLDASAPPSPDDTATRTPSSYIAGRSAPSTPGILSLSQSRSTSRSRRHSKNPTASAYAYDGYFLGTDAPQRAVGEIPKAKSTSVLLPGSAGAAPVIAGEGKKLHHVRTRTGDLRMPRERHHTTSEAADEWLHRAGLAIAGETRESKGQSWLVRRASSTSLVRQSDGWDEHPSHEHEGVQLMKLISGEHFDVEGATGFTSPRALSRFGSRTGSRVHSARGSRRGSRVFSRLELMTPAELPHGVERDGYFEDVLEPDFVEGDEESVGDEEEVARLARERGFGLGGWMDRLIGWSLFSVDEDGESSEDDDGVADGSEDLTREELRLRKEVEVKRKKMERETIIAASAAGSKERAEEVSGVPKPQPVPAEGEGGWQDAAWLLTVASKVLL